MNNNDGTYGGEQAYVCTFVHVNSESRSHKHQGLLTGFPFF